MNSIDPAGSSRLSNYRRLTFFGVLVTFGLIMLGAWVRLTDAGLGCPDWPGCYGKLTPTQAADDIAREVAAQGGEHGPVSMGKAWREMIHRYVASFLGLLALLLAWLGWRWRQSLPGSPWLAIALLGLVIVQGLFGMWTVTLLLRPWIVTTHLIGGMLTLAVLVWLWRRLSDSGTGTHWAGDPGLRSLRMPVTIGLLALSAQIVLGGWTSTNYAALACTDFPTCQGHWWPVVDFASGFNPARELGMTADGQILSAPALTAIHLAHRLGAIVATLCLVWLILTALRFSATRTFAAILAVALIGQLLLGLSNVLLSLPISVAVAHNGLAAGLVALVLMIKFRVFQAPNP